MTNKLTSTTPPATTKAAKIRPHAANADAVIIAAGIMNPHDIHDDAIENTQVPAAPIISVTTNKTAHTLRLPSHPSHPTTALAPTHDDASRSKVPPDSPKKSVGSPCPANPARKPPHQTATTSLTALRLSCKRGASRSSPTLDIRTNLTSYNALMLRRTAPRTGLYNSHQQRTTPNRKAVAPSPYTPHVGQ